MEGVQYSPSPSDAHQTAFQEMWEEGKISKTAKHTYELVCPRCTHPARMKERTEHETIYMEDADFGGNIDLVRPGRGMRHKGAGGIPVDVEVGLGVVSCGCLATHGRTGDSDFGCGVPFELTADMQKHPPETSEPDEPAADLTE